MPSNLDRITALMFHVGRRLRAHGSGPDLPTVLRFHTLVYVNESGKPLMKDVATYLRIKPSSATSLINGLVHSGHLRRHLDPRDRRIVRLSLTPKGKLLLRRGKREALGRLKIILAKLNNQEQQQLITILTKIADSSASSV